MVIRDFVEGWTDPIDVQLRRDQAAFDATGSTIAVVAIDGNGTSVTLTGTVDWIDVTVGTVRYTPAAGDLLASRSPLKVRFKVTSGSGAVSYHPKQGVETWRISGAPK